jgi:hypothetical protein
MGRFVPKTPAGRGFAWIIPVRIGRLPRAVAPFAGPLPVSQNGTGGHLDALTTPDICGTEREAFRSTVSVGRHEGVHPMPHKSAKFLTAVLASTGLVVSPLAAQAGQVGHYGTSAPNLRCPEVPQGHPGNRSVVINRPVTTNIENNVNVYKPTNIQNNINVYKPVTITNNIDNSKNITVYKPVNINNNIDITKNIDNSKNIDITKNIDNSKNINASKNIEINKSIVINKNVDVQVSAIAQAQAQAFAAAGAASGAISFAGFSGGIPESPGFVAGGEINVNVEAAAPACTWQETTVIKAIHALCVSEDHHEFPASHMVEDSWIRAGYEGEIARCLPGSTLKVTIGSVMQSSEGAAVSTAHGETLMCAPQEALRYYKGGLLKCAPAVKVPDCTERTNLRKYGTGDMFFSYVTRVCLETGRELVGAESREPVRAY